MRRLLATLTLAVGALGCGSSDDSVAPIPGPSDGGTSNLDASNGDAMADGSATTSGPFPIHHIVVIVKENHTFDNYFGSFPGAEGTTCLLYTSPSPRDRQKSRMPSSA